MVPSGFFACDLDAVFRHVENCNQYVILPTCIQLFCTLLWALYVKEILAAMNAANVSSHRGQDGCRVLA